MTCPINGRVHVVSAVMKELVQSMDEYMLQKNNKIFTLWPMNGRSPS